MRAACSTLSWPIENIGPSLPNLLATIAGNLFELRQVSGLRLLDLRLPAAFADAYPGPKFGIAGHAAAGRRRGRPADRHDHQAERRPVAGGDGATWSQTLVDGGIDFIKDDELQADGPHCPFDERVRAVMRVVNEARRSQRPQGDVRVQHHRRARRDAPAARPGAGRAGGTCVMVSLNSVGLVGLLELRRHAQLPIHGHRNGWG